jgi:hypothetical protein
MDYYERAYALPAGTGMLGLSREEADYWTTFTDGHGNHLLGSKQYVLHLPVGGIPSKAFWSVTLDEVEKEGQFLTPNPIDRYEISSHSPGLVENSDGTVDIWIQATEPSPHKLTNWLPSPVAGRPFILLARSYEPKPEVLRGDFKMPAVEALP